MAIKKKQDVAPLPEPIREQAKTAFRYKVVADFYGDKFDEKKRELFEVIANDPHCPVNLVVGQSLHFSEGLLRWQERSNFDVDHAKIVEAFEAGKVTVHTILAMVSKFNRESVQALVPESILPLPPTEFGVLQPTAHYREELLAVITEEDRILAEFRGDDVPVAVSVA